MPSGLADVFWTNTAEPPTGTSGDISPKPRGVFVACQKPQPRGRRPAHGGVAVSSPPPPFPFDVCFVIPVLQFLGEGTVRAGAAKSDANPADVHRTTQYLLLPFLETAPLIHRGIDGRRPARSDIPSLLPFSNFLVSIRQFGGLAPVGLPVFAWCRPWVPRELAPEPAQLALLPCGRKT